MVSRVLAVVAAVGMIAGAYVFRYGLPGGDDDDGNGGGGGERAGAVICATELGEACAALPGATVERAAVTADRLASARSAREAGVAVWVAPGPWAAMVDADRGAQPPIFDEAEVVASSPLVVVTRVAQPIEGCGSDVTWRCLGDAAQDPSFRLAADPDGTPAGLFSRAAALGGFLGVPDYAINDLDEVPDASGWLANFDRTLDRAGSFGAGSISQFLITPGAARGYVTTAAATAPASARQDMRIDAPAPAARIEVTVARPLGGGADIDVDRLRDALEAAGWSVGPPTGDDGLPSPGVLVALRGRLE